jgi:hypothetical protein
LHRRPEIRGGKLERYLRSREPRVSPCARLWHVIICECVFADTQQCREVPLRRIPGRRDTQAVEIGEIASERIGG